MDLEELKLTDKRMNICKRLDLKDSDDILHYYPFKYEEFNLTHYADFKEGERVVFEALLISRPTTFRFKGKMSKTSFRVLYEEEELLITIFNRPWVSTNNEHKLTIVGKYEGKNRVTASNFYTKDINEILGITPVYSLKEGIKQSEIKNLVNYTFKKVKTVNDLVPKRLLDKHHLIDLYEALYSIHNPSDASELKKALARLKYDEFLRFYLSLGILNGDDNVVLKDAKTFDVEKINSFIKDLPYSLTSDQKTSIQAILNDLRSDRPMYRLLQGEVGSGKTVVAFISLYANYLAGYQGALMAPTEILAKQHYLSFKKMFKDVRVELLVGNGSENKKIKEMLANGEIDVVIGTHALFSEDVEFNKLGLVITDEQHRFGVKQRRALKEKGDNVDVLMMSATPIPRTLASSLYGNMDISSIMSLPSGRKGCDTYLIKKNSIVDILDDLKRQLDLGKQIYIVASSIEASDSFKGKDVNSLYESLIDVFKPYSVGLLHGKKTSEEKDEILENFRNNKIQVLVSTTVIEVGINVPNATVMVIYDADRFGLSQIHQLRGRVQRGNDKGTCYLLTNSNEAETLKRLEVLVKTNDGFKISEQDLMLRGPGDILGTRQSGLPTFILGNLFSDTNFIEASKEDAKEIMDNLDNDENKMFYDDVIRVMGSIVGD